MIELDSMSLRKGETRIVGAMLFYYIVELT